MIDLHMHSNYSDGTCSIEEILEQVKKLNLNQFAITDHNILEGSIKASTLTDIDFVIGTELSSTHRGCEVHLLSYFPNGSPTDYKNIKFIISEGETYKKIAVMEMVENLNAMGYDINVIELRKYTKGIINRVHICKALIDHGYIKSVSEGFEKLIGDHCPAFVERKTVSLFEAIEAVHKDGGIAIIAHPYEYDKLEPIDDFLNEVKDVIDGIECFHPSANKKQQAHLVEFATNNNLMITGGSDFHGSNKPDIHLGMMNVEDKYKINR